MKENNLVDIQAVKADKKKRVENRKLDAQASYVCIEKCLKYLEMNKLEELDDLKIKMKETMKLLVKIGKNG